MDDGLLEPLTRSLNDPERFADAFQSLYPELRRIALGRGRGHTMTPTALVGELFLRVRDAESLPLVRDRHHFLVLAARTMRWIMVDHARRRLSGKRGGDLLEVTLLEDLPQADSDRMVVALQDALQDLKAIAPRQHDIVELHYFGGLGFEQIGEALGCSERTARREWERARAFLHAQLDSGGDGE